MAKLKTKKEWTPEYKYETLEGKFTDFTGEEKEFTMVAVSIPMDEETYIAKKSELEDEPKYDYMFDDTVDIVDTVSKVLSIGVSVRSNADKKVEGLSTQIAYGKACKWFNHAMYVNDSGMINTEMVHALLQQEAKYFTKDPGHFIAGYNSDKARYEAKHKKDVSDLYAGISLKTIDSPHIDFKTYEDIDQPSVTQDLKNILWNEATITK